MRICRTIFAGPRVRRGFTVVEIMIVVLIMSIIGVLSVGAVADFEANQRADRAAREALAVFRFARSLAMTTGKNAKVRVVSSATAATLTVYHKDYATADGYDYNQPFASGLTASGTMTLNLGASKELVGTSISPAGTTDFEFNILGSCTSTGTITFGYAGKSKAIAISKVGDPTIP
jgi:prepilin-type N-terminal cleavage/methylation domain-containing protein